jgi:hypothetical protein
MGEDDLDDSFLEMSLAKCPESEIPGSGHIGFAQTVMETEMALGVLSRIRLMENRYTDVSHSVLPKSGHDRLDLIILPHYPNFGNQPAQDKLTLPGPLLAG